MHSLKFLPDIEHTPCEPEVLRQCNPPEPLDFFRSVSDKPYSFFLDSACDHSKLGRYSFIGFDPFLVFRSKGRKISLEYRNGRKHSIAANPFMALKELLNRYPAKTIEEMPFTGGAVGYFSYDMKDLLEKLPRRAEDDLMIPECIVGFYDSVAIYDNFAGHCYISKCTFGEKDAKAPDMEKAMRRIKRPDIHTQVRGGIRSNFSKNSYIYAVKKAKEYIKKGDIYQVNISQRLQAKMAGDPMGLYVKLRECSPAPFSSYFNFKEVKVASSSPERFLFKRGDYIETRPIKGTRPRSENMLSDISLENELRQSYKDRAEHIMIVDLERNDLGKICEYGSVVLKESSIIERYANVFHMVSTISGKLRSNIDPIDCVMATFPGGSITGAPKIRSMEIIDELEPVKRAIYTGAAGYIGFDGSMDTSIVIRTFIVKDGDVYFQVGGGIVADSDPEKEYEETLHKAAGLMDALKRGSKNMVCVMS